MATQPSVPPTAIGPKRSIAFETVPSSAGSNVSGKTMERSKSILEDPQSRRQSGFANSSRPSSTNAPHRNRDRELSMTATERKLSSMKQDDFSRPVTAEDVTSAFAMLSRDGRKITKDDVKVAFETYFPNCPNKILKILQGGKEELTKEALHVMLVSKPCSTDHFKDAYELFEPTDEGIIPDATLLRLIKEINPHKMPYKKDLEALKEKLDKNKDGVINIDDFKRMSSRPPSAY
ncbi:hypothetical protein HDV05_006768 [Chytridiales sp. JEL 0842]|nr:hypothetical protein HDV05_006768 [Chytridiales sp. JEL 0842]